MSNKTLHVQWESSNFAWSAVCTLLQVLNAQLAGYQGVIIYNYDPIDPDVTVMGATNGETSQSLIIS